MAVAIIAAKEVLIIHIFIPPRYESFSPSDLEYYTRRGKFIFIFLLRQVLVAGWQAFLSAGQLKP